MVVEAAILLPFFLILTLALMEYGWMYLKSEEIANAARHGARVGARIDATNADIEAAVAALMSAAGIGGYNVTIELEEGSGVAPVPGGGTVGDTLTVAIQVPYAGSALELVGVPLIPVPAQLRFSVSMAKERS